MASQTGHWDRRFTGWTLKCSDKDFWTPFLPWTSRFGRFFYFDSDIVMAGHLACVPTAKVFRTGILTARAWTWVHSQWLRKRFSCTTHLNDKDAVLVPHGDNWVALCKVFDIEEVELLSLARMAPEPLLRHRHSALRPLTGKGSRPLGGTLTGTCGSCSSASSRTSARRADNHQHNISCCIGVVDIPSSSDTLPHR